MCSLLAEQPHSPCRWSTVRLGNRVSTNDCKSFCVTGARNYLVASSCCEQATRTSSSSSTNCSSNWVDDKTSSSLISENNSYTQSELWSLLYKFADADRTCLIRNTAYRARCASTFSPVYHGHWSGGQLRSTFGLAQLPATPVTAIDISNAAAPGSVCSISYKARIVIR